ncbi:hypothetical protein X953_09415 [Virgibacillus sp. SK37]|nr:hypothetical protein X953_09415 [Virgibacillus sp. SK37]
MSHKIDKLRRNFSSLAYKNNCVAGKFTEILNLNAPPLRKTLRFSGAADEPPHANAFRGLTYASSPPEVSVFSSA